MTAGWVDAAAGSAVAVGGDAGGAARSGVEGVEASSVEGGTAAAATVGVAVAVVATDAALAALATAEPYRRRDTANHHDAAAVQSTFVGAPAAARQSVLGRPLRARAASRPRWYRSCGSLARPLTMTACTASEMSGFLARQPQRLVQPRHDDVDRRIARKRHGALHFAQRDGERVDVRGRADVALATCSGAMYSGVPSDVPVVVSRATVGLSALTSPPDRSQKDRRAVGRQQDVAWFDVLHHVARVRSRAPTMGPISRITLHRIGCPDGSQRPPSTSSMTM